MRRADSPELPFPDPLLPGRVHRSFPVRTVAPTTTPLGHAGLGFPPSAKRDARRRRRNALTLGPARPGRRPGTAGPRSLRPVGRRNFPIALTPRMPRTPARRPSQKTRGAGIYASEKGSRGPGNGWPPGRTASQPGAMERYTKRESPFRRSRRPYRSPGRRRGWPAGYTSARTVRARVWASESPSSEMPVYNPWSHPTPAPARTHVGRSKLDRLELPRGRGPEHVVDGAPSPTFPALKSRAPSFSLAAGCAHVIAVRAAS